MAAAKLLDRTMPEQLPEGYHLNNFLSLVCFVRNHYADLLSHEERRYADDFQRLPPQSQSLYVRLALRKGPVFRSDKLNYRDIDDIQVSAAQLQRAGFLNHQADIDERLGLHTKAELLQWLPARAGLKALKRDALLECIVCEVNVLQRSLPFELYRPLGSELLQRFQLLFFGNLNQDFSEFVLTDMGMLTYEKYRIDSQHRLFNSRHEVEQQWQHYQLREQCRQLIEEKDFQRLTELVSRELSTPENHLLKDRVFARRRDRLRNYVARHLERQQLDQQAFELYERSSATPSRERRVRLLNKRAEHNAALALCEQMVAAPIDEEEQEFALRFADQLSAKIHRKSRLSPTVLDYDEVTLTLDKPEGQAGGVEEAVRRWFEYAKTQEGESWQSFYVENGLIPGLFGLCFWDLIFAPVKGAFVNPYQRGPLDLFTPAFQQARHSDLELRFAQLACGKTTQSRVVATYKQKIGTTNYLVNWAGLTQELLELALDCIPVTHLLAMFRRLLFDLRNNRSGFPDLICFNRDRESQNRYLMVEVKGPGDQLQNNQKRWIKAFTAQRIPFQLARVIWNADD